MTGSARAAPPRRADGLLRVTLDAPPLPEKVPVFDSVAKAYIEVFGQTERFLRLAAIPLVLGIILGIPESLGPRFDMIPRQVSIALATIGSTLLSMAFSVRWYRFVLLKEPSPALFGPGFLRYLGLTVLLFMPPMALADVEVALLTGPSPDNAGGILASFGALGLLLVAIRCSLALAAGACGFPLGLREAWGRLKGNFWRLFGAMMLCGLPAILVYGIVVKLTMRGIGTGGSVNLGVILVAQAAQGIVGYLLLALSASLVSVFYRRIMRTDRLI